MVITLVVVMLVIVVVMVIVIDCGVTFILGGRCYVYGRSLHQSHGSVKWWTLINRAEYLNQPNI